MNCGILGVIYNKLSIWKDCQEDGLVWVMGFFPAQAEDDQLDTSGSPAVMTPLYNDAIHQELCAIKDAAQLVLLFLFNCFSSAVNLVLSVANYACCSQQINVHHLAIGALLNREV